MKRNNRNYLSLTSLVLITVGSVDSIRNLPATSLFGSTLIFFFSVAALVFLIPTALVSAELASTWPKKGGVYVWVKKAFGPEIAVLAVWFQWVENVIWFPTILSFIAGTIAYLFLPQLSESRIYLTAVILAIFWIITCLNIKGIKISAWVGNFCGITGVLLPMALIIGFGIYWVGSGQPMQITFSSSKLLPNLIDPNLLVSLTGIILCFCGMEITTMHASDVKSPQKNFPKALIMSVIIILATLIMAALSIAIVVPHNKLSLVTGIMQAYTEFFSFYHLNYLVPFIAICIVIGGLGGINNWIIAPLKGLSIAADEMNLHALSALNKRGAPCTLLIAQAVIGSLVSMLFLFAPSINSSYWMLTALSSQLYMLMYIIMFAAAIRLRYKHAGIDRPYKVPFGNIGMWLIAGLGIVASLFTVIIGFYPPQSFHINNIYHYMELMGIGLLITSMPPLLFVWGRSIPIKIQTRADLQGSRA